MIKESHLKAISNFCRSGILYDEDSVTDVFRELIKVYEKCCFKSENDDEITTIFKLFVSCGGTTKFIKDVGTMKLSELSNIIFFRQANDIEITLLAKYIYANSGSRFNEFLKWQVNAILENGEICIKDEFRKWKLETGWTEDEIETSIQKTLMD